MKQMSNIKTLKVGKTIRRFFFLSNGNLYQAYDFSKKHGFIEWINAHNNSSFERRTKCE